MRIVLANSAFHDAGGSETYLLTLGQNLVRLGHEVRVFAHTAGDAAEMARRSGIPVVTDTADLGDPAEAVVAQDGAVAYELAAAWPSVPQVFVCHSSLFDFQQPPLVPEYAAAVVVLNDRVRRRVEALNADLRVVRLRQPIDTQRFSPRSAPADQPRRALILSNYLSADLRAGLVQAWGSAGVEVVQVGGDAGRTATPEEAINEADIVVARGRAALEAMSCGRPTYVYDTWGGDGWITPDSYPGIEADGITGQSGGPKGSTASLLADLGAYDPEWGRLGRELVLAHHDARQHAADLLDVLRELAPTSRTTPTLESELSRQVALRWAAEGELFSIRAALQRAAEREQALADQVAQLTESNRQTGEDVASLLDKVAELEQRDAHMRERREKYRRRIQRLKKQLAEAEDKADRSRWLRW